MSDGGRPQDQGRRHRRGGNPSPETTSLLARWQEALRRQLSIVLDELDGPVPDPGMGLVPVERKPPPVKDRIPLVDLGVKIARELGTEVDRTPPADAAAPIPIRRRARSKIDFGPG